MKISNKMNQIMQRCQQRKVWQVAGVLFLCLLLAGCGKNTTTGDPNRIVYVAEYRPLEIGDGWVNNVVAQDGNVYILVNEYSEEAQKSINKFVKIGLADGTSEDIVLPDLQENENISGVTFNDKGNFLMLTTVYQETDSRYYFYEMTPDGQKVNEKEMTDSIADHNFQYVNTISSDGQGNVYLSGGTETGETILLAMDATGALKGIIEAGDYINSMVGTDEGLYLTSWSTSGAAGMVLRKVDTATNEVGPEISLTGISSMNSLNLCAGGPTGVLVSNQTGLYECTVETGACVKILDWLESDIAGTDFGHFGVVSADSYWVFNQVHNGENSTTELIVLNQTTAGKLPQKEIVTFGTMGIDQNARMAIVNFNKANPTYRIELKDYAPDSYESYEDFQNSLIKFNSDLAGADSPDVIDLSNVNYEMLASKGALADLYPYMDKDENFKREDYLENILSAFETDGELTGIMTGFSVNTLVGSEELLAGTDRWTIEELVEFAEKYPESKLLSGTSGSILSMLVNSNLNQFINWDTGECFFQGEDFIKILEFSNTFDKEWDYEDMGETYEQLANKEYLLMDYYIADTTVIQLMKAMFGGPVKFIGYPAMEDEGSGIRISPAGAMSISARSKVKDGAWEFISYMLSDELQDPLDGGYMRMGGYGLPVKKSALDKYYKQAMGIDEDGNSSQERVGGWSFNGFDVEIHNATEAEIAQFKDVIARADGLASYDLQINNIVFEEAESFFAGQKTAAEVADIIQSRVKIYVNENR